jgi:hypothetical protein
VVDTEPHRVTSDSNAIAPRGARNRPHLSCEDVTPLTLAAERVRAAQASPSRWAMPANAAERGSLTT